MLRYGTNEKNNVAQIVSLNTGIKYEAQNYLYRLLIRTYVRRYIRYKFLILVPYGNVPYVCYRTSTLKKKWTADFPLQ